MKGFVLDHFWWILVLAVIAACIGLGFPLFKHVKQDPEWLAIFGTAFVNQIIAKSKKIKSNSIIELLLRWHFKPHLENKTMKTVDILKEELKKAGIDVAEEVLEKTVDVICEKVAPRLALEADEAAVKMIAGGLVMIYPTIKPALNKATDLNKDGQ